MRVGKWLLGVLGLVFLTGCRTDPVALPEKYVLVDVRTLEEYEAGHLKGAVLIPYNVIRDRISAAAPNKESPVFIYCHSGRRASLALRTLEAMGYTQVVNLGGLSTASQKTQLPILK